MISPLLAALEDSTLGFDYLSDAVVRRYLQMVIGARLRVWLKAFNARTLTPRHVEIMNRVYESRDPSERKARRREKLHVSTDSHSDGEALELTAAGDVATEAEYRDLISAVCVTVTEERVAELLSDGATRRDIAAALGVNKNTVQAVAERLRGRLDGGADAIERQLLISNTDHLIRDPRDAQLHQPTVRGRRRAFNGEPRLIPGKDAPLSWHNMYFEGWAPAVDFEPVAKSTEDFEALAVRIAISNIDKRKQRIAEEPDDTRTTGGRR